MIMLGSSQNDSVWGRQIKQPRDRAYETQSPCLFVADADAVYARATETSGARIVLDIKDESYGCRFYLR